MNDTDNRAVTDGENNPVDGAAKTFTQDDVNRIVGERLSREKAKLESDIVQREQELQTKEFMLIAKGKLQEKGLSLDLLEALNTSSAEAFDKSLVIMEQQFKRKSESTAPTYWGNGPTTGSLGNFARRSYSNADSQTDPIKTAMGLK